MDSDTMTADVLSFLLDLARAWLPALATAMAITIAADGLGRIALMALGVHCPRAESHVFAVGLGAGLLALLIFGAGLAGMLTPFILAGLLAVGAAGWLISLPSETAADVSAAEFTGWQIIPSVSLLATAGLVGFGLLMPEFFHDALIYHLELPRYWLRHRHISLLPWNYNSALPANIEQLYAVALAFADERGTKLLHAGLGLLCVLSLWRLGCALDGRSLTGWLAATFFVATPAVTLLATVSGNDLGLTAFGLLSALAWLHWRRTLRRSWLLLSALLMGCSLGAKYSAAFLLAGFALAWAASWRRPPATLDRAGALRQTGLWLLVAAAVAAPWYLRTFLITGQLFYPAFAAGAPFIDETGLRLLRRDLGTGGVAPALWADYFPRLIATDIGWLTAGAAAIGLAGALAGTAWAASIRPLLPLILGSLAAWWFTSPVPRYLTPAVALLAVIAAAALMALASHRRLRAAAWIIMLAGLTAQWLTAAALFRDNYLEPFGALGPPAARPPDIERTLSSPWPVMRNGPERRQWLAWSVPPYAVMEAANRLLPPSAKVLFVAEYRGSHLERDRIVSTKYDRSPLIEWAKDSRNEDELAARLRQEGVTHLLFNAMEARRLEQEGYPAFRWPDARSRAVFEQLRREKLTVLHVENGVFLYEVR
ncbi:MAG: phospholipid carrier-dependent glycosyltransferase [Nitrospirota bacterium]